MIFLKAPTDLEEPQKYEIQFACARPQHILTPIRSQCAT
jgi:DNA polymerase III delta prime subunit